MKFAALLIAVLAFPASALGAESWRSPEPLSQAGTDNGTARIATNSPGVAALIWNEFANGRTPRFRIRVSTRQPNSTWTPSEQLSGAGEAGSGAVGVDPQGRITAVWDEAGAMRWATKVPGEQEPTTWADRASLFLAGALLTAFLVTRDNEWMFPVADLRLLDKESALRVGGYGVLLFALVLAALWGRGQARRARESHRECPDCKETIKRQALVCKHCGFRFGPKPEWSSE